METIRQNGKIILHSNDGTSIKMIFKNLTGRNFQGQEYMEYIRHIAIGDMELSPGIIGIAGMVKLSAKGQFRMYESETPMKLQLHRSFFWGLTVVSNLTLSLLAPHLVLVRTSFH